MLIEYEKSKRIETKVFKWSYKWQHFKTFFMWKFPKVRKYMSLRHWPWKKGDDNIYKTFIKAISEYLSIWDSGSHVRYVTCESCGAVGIDHNSEKYEWKYEGGHMWVCPKCKGERK